MTTIKRKWIGRPVDDIYGTFTPDAFLANIGGSIARSPSGYYAAWLNRNGNLIAVTSHAALGGGYKDSFDKGYACLAFEDDSLYVELPSDLTSRQIIAILHLVAKRYGTRGDLLATVSNHDPVWITDDSAVFHNIAELLTEVLSTFRTALHDNVWINGDVFTTVSDLTKHLHMQARKHD